MLSGMRLSIARAVARRWTDRLGEWPRHWTERLRSAILAGYAQAVSSCRIVETR